MIRISSYINLCVCLSCFKLLFLKSYVSTDFDVHRNWLAITYNLPVKDWYLDSTSQWTLDYPPLFAAFEFFLAIIAHLIGLEDDLKLTEASLRTDSIVTFQKLTVILTDLIYYYAVFKLCHVIEPLTPKTSKKKKKNNDQEDKQLPAQAEQTLLSSLYKPDMTSSIALLLLFLPGLLLVDHIHFQYNGLLSGVLLLSMANIISRNYGLGSFWFAILLNLKHIYLYFAPAFGMYLLASYCLAKQFEENRIIAFVKRTSRLAVIVLAVVLITYSPFAEVSALRQIFERLFPFRRGLTHAYWAPNIWSLYNSADKILAAVMRISPKTKFDMDSISSSRTILSSTSGLVQEYEHLYLPSIRPVTTFILVGAFTVPLVIKFLFTFGREVPLLFIKGTTQAAFTAFMFGWHVHEKAVLMVLLPLVPLAFLNLRLRAPFLRMILAGTYQLFPLFFQPAEYLTKLTILAAYYHYAITLKSLRQNHTSNTAKEPTSRIRSLANRIYKILDNSFVILIILTEIYIILIHGRLNYSWNPLAILNKYEFLPLMLTSSISALGITSSYLELYYEFVSCAADEVVAAAA